MKMIYKILQIICFATIFASNVFAQNQYKATATTVKFFSETPVENIDAVTNEATSIISIPKNQIAFSIPNKSFLFKNALMQEHFNEKYMESDKYPNSTFAGTIIDAVDLSKDGEYKLNVTGKLKIHGVEKQVIAPAYAKVKNGKVSLQSQFMVKLVDYKIKVPTLVFNKIAEEIKIVVNADYDIK